MAPPAPIGMTRAWELALIYLLPDDFLGQERLAEIRQSCGEPDLVALNTIALDGQRLALDELAAAAGALPFLADKRLVVVRRLLAQFESRPGEGARDGRRGRRSDDIKPLLALLERIPPTTHLVLLEQTVAPQGTPSRIRRAIVELGGEIMETRRLSAEEVVEWVDRRVRAKGGRVHPEAAALLSAAVGDDLRRLDCEIDKLLAYAAGADVTASDVRLLVSEARDDDVFDLVEAVGRRDRRRALAVLRELLGRGAAVPYVLTMIARQFRLLLQTRELLVTTSDQRQIAVELGLQPWQARSLIGQARRFSLGDLELAYHRLVTTDQAVKTGRLEGEVALDLLVAELTGR